MRTVIIGIAVALTMTGCTIERTVVQEQTTTTQSDYYAPDEDAFIESVVAVSGPLLVPRSDVLESGWITCDGIDLGASRSDIEDIILSSASSEAGVTFLTAIFASAVLYLCPEYSFMIEGY